MKGTIVKCLEEVVQKLGGPEAWERTLTAAGQDGKRVFITTEDVPDAEVVAMIEHAAKTLGVSTQAAMDAFGMHWSTEYAPRLYKVYFDRASNVREFLLGMAKVHETVTRRMQNARPPVFTYDDSAPDALVVEYSSDRGLAALMPGLIHGAAKYYGETVDVKPTGNRMHVTFKSAQSKRAA